MSQGTQYLKGVALIQYSTPSIHLPGNAEKLNGIIVRKVFRVYKGLMQSVNVYCSIFLLGRHTCF